MNKPPSQALFALVESFFTGYLPRQRGASVHTIRAYRDSLKLLFEFTAQHCRRDVASLDVADLDAEAITAFLDHIEANRSNSATTRNCRRAALRSFFKHLVRHDLTHSLQYTRVLAIPAKRARQLPATYLEADDVRGILAKPNRRTGVITRCSCFSTTAALASARHVRPMDPSPVGPATTGTPVRHRSQF